ncbi:unnamed protein product [Calypogeia fissa]
MAQYQTNTDVPPHKPSMVEKLTAKAEGLVEKVTGKSHTTGMGGVGTTGNTQQQQPGGYGGQQQQPGGYGGQQQQPGGYGGQQQDRPMTGADTYEAGMDPYGQQPQQQSTGQSIIDKVKNAVTGHQGQSNNMGAGTGTGTDYSSATGTGGMSTIDKIKNMIPGHHKTDAGTGAGTGTGY